MVCQGTNVQAFLHHSYLLTVAHATLIRYVTLMRGFSVFPYICIIGDLYNIFTLQCKVWKNHVCKLYYRFYSSQKKKNMTYLTILFSLVNYAVLANLILLQKKILPRF